MGAPECSVSSDTKKLTDVLAFKAVNDFTNILGTPGTRKDTSSDVVDVLNGFRIEFHRLMFERRNESLESVAEPLDVPNPVIVIKLHHQSPDHIVDSWTQPSAGDDSCADFRWIVIYVFPGSCFFEGDI